MKKSSTSVMKFKYTPMERWEILLQKVMNKFNTNKDINGNSDWVNMYASYCTNVLMPMRKIKSMEILGRWVRLT